MVLGDILVAHANDCGMKFNAHFLGKAVRSEGFYLDGCMLGEYNANGLLFKHEGFHCPSLVFEVKAQWPERQILNSIQQLVVHVRVLVVFVYVFIPDFGKLHPFLEAEGLSITVEDKTVNLDWCMPVKFDTNWMVLEEVGLVIKINRHAFELFGLWRWCRCHWSRSSGSGAGALSTGFCFGAGSGAGFVSCTTGSGATARSAGAGGGAGSGFGSSLDLQQSTKKKMAQQRRNKRISHL